jgi:hypothetical protein
MTLALTILTAGVAGPIASVLVKDKAAKVFEKLAENMQGKASKTALEAAGEMVKDSAGDLTKKGLEKVAQEVSKAYERPSVEDAFHSSGVPPDQYGDQLQEAIDLQTGVLQKLITAFMRKGSAGMTMDDAKQLLSRILNTDFVKYPPSAVKKGVPEKEGERGVVAGVGLGPRPGVLGKAQLTVQCEGVVGFEPVRRVLVDQLQFPASAINQTGLTMGRTVPMINMIEFIKWSFGPGARAALFAGMPMNPQGRLFAEIQMNQNLLNVTFKKLGIVQADED